MRVPRIQLFDATGKRFASATGRGSLLARLGLDAAARRLGNLGRDFWVAFLLACLIVLVLEKGFDYLVETGDLRAGEFAGGITQSIFNINRFYQMIVAAPRNPVPRYTIVIQIDHQEACPQREMTTQLLYKLADALPSVVVLDKHYPPHRPACPHDEEFIRAIQVLRHNHIPVIVGRNASVEERYLTPSIVFDDLDPCLGNADVRKDSCLEGVLNRDADTRKLPLEWKLFPSEEDARKQQKEDWYDTLALKAARAYDKKLEDHHPFLSNFLSSAAYPRISFLWAQPPYIGFLKDTAFEHITSSEVLADSSDADTEHWPSFEKLPLSLRKLTGKIVLIGEVEGDFHPTVMGRMSGLYLQANYIEALLDDRYFRAVPVLDYVFGFGFLAGLQLIMVVFGRQWRLVILLIPGLLILLVALLYLLIMHAGWYVNPVPVGATAIAVRVLHLLFGWPERKIPGESP